MFYTKVFMKRVYLGSEEVDCQAMQKEIDAFLSKVQERENIKFLKLKQTQSPVTDSYCLVTISVTYQDNRTV